MRRRLAYAFAALVALGLTTFGGLRYRYGGGQPFVYEGPTPIEPTPALETLVELETPPGNIAVADDGSVFFTFHPDAHPPYPLAELVDGKAQPFRGAEAVDWVAPLAVRIDAQQRLWVLDTGLHAFSSPRLVAFDLETRELVHDHRFDSTYAPFGSHYNDFRFSRDGKHLIIADASIVRKTPALIVYEPETGKTRRVLESDDSLLPGDYVITVDGEPVIGLGFFSLRPGVDSIAYDAKNDELVFAALTNPHLQRLAMSDLLDESLSDTQLASRVKQGLRKPVTDGMVADAEGRVYAGDMQSYGLVRFDDDGVTTLLIDRRIDWLDGLDIGPDGSLYLSCSALHRVLLQSEDAVREMGPYSILRVKP